MKIRTKLYLSAALSIGLMSLLSLLLILFSFKINEELKKNTLADEFTRAITGLLILTDKYLAHQAVRTEQQLGLKLKDIEEITKNSEGFIPLEIIRNAFASLKESFSYLKANYRERKELLKRNASREEIDRTNYLEERLTDIMRSNAQKILAISFRISSEALKETNNIQKRGTLLFSAFAVLLVFIIGTSALLITRSITEPIKELIRGTGIIGKGNLEHRIDIKRRDETGLLSQAFNEMVEKHRGGVVALRQRFQEMTALSTLAEQVSASLSLDQVVQAALDGIVAPVATDLALLFLRDGHKLTLQGFRSSSPKFAHDKTPVHRVGECLCGLAVSEGKALYSKDIHKDPRCTWEECKKAGFSSFVSLPLRSGDEIIGVIGLASSTEQDFEKQATFLDTLSSAISIGLQNALLHEQVKQHGTELEERVAERTNELKEKTEEIRESEQALTYLLEDVNEAREELEKANIKLKELDRLKSMFIASMSHELRTPLNSIIGFTGIILQGMTGEINAEQKDQLQRVSGSAKHLLNLITDIIDVSKIEAEKVEVHVEEFSLDGVIREAVSNLTPEITDKGLDLEISLPPDTQLMTDRKRLLQCILNFLSNAVKFTEKGNIRITAHEVDGMMEIKVSDTGIGIKEEDLSRLFKSFVRLDTPLKTIIPGTGLGLYLTKKLATEVLKGSVSVESKYGEGSTFALRVPKEI